MVKELDGYTFFILAQQNLVVCTKKFAGKSHRAVAKCSPEDKFDIELGMEIAKARCQVKVLKQKAKFAKQNATASREAANKAFIHADYAFAKAQRAEEMYQEAIAAAAKYNHK